MRGPSSRGPSMSAPRGSAPRGGTSYVAPRGGSVSKGQSSGRGYNGGRGGYYGGRGYPYRTAYPYRPYYYPYRPIGWYAGWGWGWGGWGWGGWWGAAPGWGWGWGYPYGGGGGGYVTTSYQTGRWAAVKTDVSPEEARVILDGRYIGTADDFDGYPDMLYLQAKGTYKLEFQLDGFEPQSVDVEALNGAFIKLDNKLKKIPGAKQYGSYDTPEPEGGVQRYFGKGNAGAGTGPAVLEAPVDNEGDTDGEGEGGNMRPPSSSPYAPPQGGSTSSSTSEPDPMRVVPSPSQGGVSTRGRIVFRVQPGDAAVYLDDRFAGTGEELSTLGRGLQVSPGPHKIFVSRPGFANDAVQIDVAPGGTETVEVSLQRP